MREKGYGYYWKNENYFKWVEEKTQVKKQDEWIWKKINSNFALNFG